MILPTVIDKINNCEHSFDIYSRLLEDRIIFITGEIDDLVANTTIAEMLYLESKNTQKDIYLYINSPGGVAQSGLAILDTIRYIKSPVCTICIGLCASAAALILASGTKGKRFILPHSKVMIHQPLGGIKGQVSEIEIYYKEGVKDKNTYASLLAEFCGRATSDVLADIDRDNYLSATEAVKYGLADKILSHSKTKGGAIHAKSKL